MEMIEFWAPGASFRLKPALQWDEFGLVVELLKDGLEECCGGAAAV